MYIALTIFVLSLIVIIAMVGNKLREHTHGKAYITVSPELDESIRRKAHIAHKIGTEFPKHFGREAFYAFVQKSVVFYRKIKAKIYPRIAHIVDAVKGKDVPMNKGGTSFFLSRISENDEKLEG